MSSSVAPVRKRVFLGLLAAIVVLGTTAGLAVLVSTRLSGVGLALINGIAAVFVALMALAWMGLTGMAVCIWLKRPFLWHTPVRVILELLYPITLRLGPVVGISKTQVQTSFVEVNNQLVRARLGGINPSRLLLLIPHCIQRSECNHKITINVKNCRMCGLCQVSELRKIQDEYGVELAVATGGGMARKIIQDLKPEAVIAVACERDLTSGLQETFPLPVYGIVNDRPNGYCFNTGVDMEKVRDALRDFIGKAKLE